MVDGRSGQGNMVDGRSLSDILMPCTWSVMRLHKAQAQLAALQMELVSDPNT